MRSLVRRAVVAAGAVVVVVGTGAGVASAAPAPMLTWSPAGPVSFGTLTPGATSAPQVFTLKNSGGSATSALTITLKPPAAGFTVTRDGCTGTSLGPKKSCTVTVAYTAPATPGQASQATLTATSNKPAATAPVVLSGAAAKASPGIITAQQPATAAAGAAVADTATVKGGFAPGGTVTFTLYDNATCNGPALFTDTEALAGGTATSKTYTMTAAGTDYWAAAYSGDSQNLPVTSGCSDEPVTITPATPAITTTQQPASATTGSAVADTATVKGGYHPGGTVTFTLYDNKACGGTPLFTDANEPLTGGAATSKTYTTAAAGTDYWVAAYNGDGNNNAVTSGCGAEPVTIGPCVVTDTTSGQSYADLPDAVTAATAGDTLDIEGTCTGITEISKNLTLTGQPTGSTTTATLDGGGQAGVLTIDRNVTVTLNTLKITGGNATGSTGAGIVNNVGTVTLNSSTVTGNTASDGGGIFNNFGTVTLNSSTVTGNTAGNEGGGIYNQIGTLVLNNSTIGSSTGAANSAGFVGGGIWNGGGTVTMNGSSSITGNTAGTSGGGIDNNSGTVTLNDSSSITGNTPDNCAGAAVTGCTG